MVAIKSFVLAAATTLVSFTTAAPTWTGTSSSLTSIVNDLVCPKGSVLFKAHNEGIVPKTSPSKVWARIGDFSDVEWQGFTLLSTTGKPNSPGSTRTFSTLGLTLTERLNLNIGSSSGSTPYLPVFYQQFTLTGQYEIYGTLVSGVQDFLSVTAKGKDSKIEWDVIGCSNNTETSVAVFSQVHGGSIDGTIARFSS